MTAPQAVSDAGWQRLDPRMLLVHPVREVVRFLPAIIGVFVAGAASGGQGWQLLGVVVPVALGVLRYLTTSFRITEGRIELKRGLISRHVLSTPVDRVRTVDLTSSLIQRVLGLTTLRVGTGTASTDGDEQLDLDGLPVDRAKELRTELLRAAPATNDVETDAPAPVVADEVVVTFDPRWVRFAPLTSSGFVLAGAVLGVGSQVLQQVDLYDVVDPTRLADVVPGLAAVVIAVAAVALLVGGLAIGGYLVTNWGFALTREPHGWHLRRGLFTTRETSLDADRVAGVTVGEPLGLRLARGGRLSAIVTGLRRSETGSSALVPPAPRTVVDVVAGRVLGVAAPLNAELVDHGPAARRRRYTRALILPALVVAVVLLVVLLTDAPAWLLLPVLLAPLAGVLLAADRARSLGHALVDDYVVARSGSLYRHRDALHVDHVIGWNLRDTWFQRRVGLTTLVATTAGGRQAVVVLDIPDQTGVSVAASALPGLVDQFLLQPQ